MAVALTDDGTALRAKALRLPPAIQAAMALDDKGLAQLREAVQAVGEAVRAAPPPAAEPA